MVDRAYEGRPWVRTAAQQLVTDLMEEIGYDGYVAIAPETGPKGTVAGLFILTHVYWHLKEQPQTRRWSTSIGEPDERWIEDTKCGVTVIVIENKYFDAAVSALNKAEVPFYEMADYFDLEGFKTLEEVELWHKEAAASVEQPKDWKLFGEPKE